ncbi:hypothetical protein COCCADRAFT_6851 [Bipolaris zeicola 26-R-13]|uniref:NAD(P)-binding domain-containing protein n=1 Tax=Cochliobolus carbonum (strain 26-R-13) TaxID=930089 RepID=W6YIX4_COCC2|nr:uncharacterized protein COCCADRAFT_6851 [Bipolaris zeicola 26-R-13]EUC31231.1 hypothetical protein COCCADRAFT_6851 [Bipolaris zeicola 26-R-13]
MPPSSPLKIAVIGPAGFGGSYLCVELINRGHNVIGISRNPAKLGKHERYIPRPVDIDAAPIEKIAETFKDADALVCEFGPHTAGAGALLYMPFLESVRKIILAHKLHPTSYFLFVGGAGSLHVPGTSLPCVDHPDFFLAYRRAISTSLAHIAYMEERLGIMGTALRRYRTARLASPPSEEDLAAIAEYERHIQSKDDANDFIKAGRTSFMFFDGRTDFNWSFVSPPALYRPGKRTGKYEISVDDMVLLGERQEGKDIFEGRLTGISVGDMAIAIADEVEQRKLVGTHWSAWGDISEDVPAPAYASLEAVGGGN